MVKRSQIEQLINFRLNEVLLVAQAALPENQFTAFRKFTLNQFGKSGLSKELDRLFKSKDYKER